MSGHNKAASRSVKDMHAMFEEGKVKYPRPQLGDQKPQERTPAATSNLTAKDSPIHRERFQSPRLTSQTGKELDRKKRTEELTTSLPVSPLVVECERRTAELSSSQKLAPPPIPHKPAALSPTSRLHSVGRGAHTLSRTVPSASPGLQAGIPTTQETLTNPPVSERMKNGTPLTDSSGSEQLGRERRAEEFTSSSVKLEPPVPPKPAVSPRLPSTSRDGHTALRTLSASTSSPQNRARTPVAPPSGPQGNAVPTAGTPDVSSRARSHNDGALLQKANVRRHTTQLQTKGKELSPPPVAPKPPVKCQKPSTQPKVSYHPPLAPKPSAHHQKPSTQPRLSSYPPLTPKPSAHHQKPSTQPKEDMLSPLAPKPVMKLQKQNTQLTAEAEESFPSQRERIQDVTRFVDAQFGRIKPSALNAKWLGEVLLEEEEDEPEEPFHDDFGPDFESTAMAVGRRLLDIQDCIRTEEIDRLALKHLLSQLERKRILICIFGRHNSGKSTFLNTLLSNKLLPMSGTNETSIKVFIKHNPQVHYGLCTKEAEEGKASCEYCPFLQVMGEEGQCEVIHGMQEIENHLRKINADVREHEQKVTNEYEVNTTVQCLSEAGAPPSWTVLLVDNPGTGEVSNHGKVMEQAELGLATGSAFVFIISYDLLDDAVDVAAFKAVYKKDRSIFDEKRVIVAVTFFDIYYDKCDNLDDYDTPLTEEDVKRKVSNHVAQATDGACSIPKENIVPICGEWAWFARVLSQQPSDQDQQKCVRKAFIHLGQKPPSTPIEMAQKLEELSGIRDIERRVSAMALSSFEMWVKSTRETLGGLLNTMDEKLVQLAEALEKHVAECKENHKRHCEQWNSLNQQLDELEARIGPTSAVKEHLVTSYQSDTKEPLRRAMKQVKEDMERFKQECQKKCRHVYTPKQFQQDVEGFLKDVSENFSRTILVNCKFIAMNEALRKHKINLGTMETNLATTTSELLHDKKIKDIGTYSEQPTSAAIENIMLGIPTGLKDLDIPSLDLKHEIWRRIINAITKLTLDAGCKPEELQEPIQDLEKCIEERCSEYFEKSETKDTIVELYFRKYHAGAESMLRVYQERFAVRVQECTEEILEEGSAIEVIVEEIRILREWSDHLNQYNMGKYLREKAEECLKQISIQESEESVTSQQEDESVHVDISTPSITAVHAQGRQLEFQAEEGLPLQQLLERELPRYDINLSDYSPLTDEGSLESQMDNWSTTFVGRDIYLQSRESSVDLETEDSTIRGRKRSDRPETALHSPISTDQSQDVVHPPTSRSQSPDAMHPPISRDQSPDVVHAPISRDQSPEVVHTAISVMHTSTKSPDTPIRIRQYVVARQQEQKDDNKASVVSPVCLDIPPAAGRFGIPHGSSVKFIGSQIAVKLPVALSGGVRTKPSEGPTTTTDLTALLADSEKDFKDDLVASCEAVKVRLEQLQSLYPFLNLVSAELIHEWNLLEKKNIHIAVIGHYNSGKSSLINALTGQRFLPVSTSLETMAKVKVKHVPGIHDPNTQSAHSDAETCMKCPRLMKEHGTTVVESGVAAISDVLKFSNRNFRVCGDAAQGPSTYVVHTNIPMFASVPKTWQVYLEDNPGFKLFAEDDQKSKFMEEVMNLSAYVYTVSYTRVQDGISAETFKLISDQDQAKAAFLQHRLIVAVTWFDQYYKAANTGKMLSEDQVKEVVCHSIKTATSRSFPRESVVPVCSQWALIARQLLQRPQDHKLKQSALRCLEFYYESQHDIEDSLTIAKTLERASGIRTLEERIVEVSRQACNDSNLDITNSCLSYVGVALKKLSKRVQVIQDIIHVHTRKEDDLSKCVQRVTAFKNFLFSQLSPSSRKTFQLYCDREVTKLSTALSSKILESFLAFQEQSVAKLSGKYTKAELDADTGPVLEALTAEMTSGLRDTPFQMRFDEIITAVDDKYQNMREDAFTFCTTAQSVHDLPPPKEAQQDYKTHLDILQDMNPSLDQQDRKSRTWRPNFRNRCTQSDIRKMCEKLSRSTEDQMKKYLDEFSERLVKLHYTQYCDYVKMKLSDFNKEILKRLSLQQEEMQGMKEEHTGSAEVFSMWCRHLERLKEHLEMKSTEALART